MSKEKIVMVSGGFDPLHIGHIDHFKKAKTLGDKLVVFINNNEWLVRKKGNYLMELNDRMAIIKELPFVDYVFTLHTKRDDISEALELVRPDIFAKGGDRIDEKHIPKEEVEVCKKYKIKIVFGVGGRIRSSSQLLKKYWENEKLKN